jgi:hypothetical protein
MKGTMPVEDEIIEAVIAKCDLIMARNEIVDMHSKLNQMAAQQGGAYYYPNEYIAAWCAFRDHPSAETARVFFENCAPGLGYFQKLFTGWKFAFKQFATEWFCSKRPRVGAFAGARHGIGLGYLPLHSPGMDVRKPAGLGPRIVSIWPTV